jgi:hypothetical protein
MERVGKWVDRFYHLKREGVIYISGKVDSKKVTNCLLQGKVGLRGRWLLGTQGRRGVGWGWGWG